MLSAAAQVERRNSRLVGMGGRARAAQVGTRCPAGGPRPHPAQPGLPRLAWLPRPPQGLQLCTVAAWAQAVETAGAPGERARVGVERKPTRRIMRQAAPRAATGLGSGEAVSRGTNPLLLGNGALERNQTTGVRCPGKLRTCLAPFRSKVTFLEKCFQRFMCGRTCRGSGSKCGSDSKGLQAGPSRLPVLTRMPLETGPLHLDWIAKARSHAPARPAE